MKICATIISHSAEHLIGDAIKSVLDIADGVLLIDTGITDGTIGIAKELAGDKLHIDKFDWLNDHGGDFSTARNYALQRAAELGYSWGLTLDTDERLVGVSRDAFERASKNVEVLRVEYVDGTYSKDRAFRLPAKGRWTGPVHEYFPPSNFTYIPGIFWEVIKEGEALLAKTRRVAEILEAYCKKDPYPRWAYYLADSYSILGEFDKAFALFDQCITANWSPEEAAWSAFRMAEIHFQFKRYDDAIRCSEKGIAAFFLMAELHWAIGSCCTWMGENLKAIEKAQEAIGYGFYRGSGRRYRQGFKYMPALFEKPYEVIAFAYNNLGDTSNRDLAAKEYETAFLARNAKREFRV